ncbi:MAG: substrate-binding domain-containing protein [Treponema sp.]|nr:substrate-binding domain-containing protein [Treponema sp.]
MKKNTIAFLTRSLENATGIDLWHGIVDNSKQEKVPIITIHGPTLKTGNDSLIYNIFDDDTFAGIISWASSDATKEAINYYQKFKKTPLVCMTFKVPGHPVIFADCRNGMIELINHLIEVHGFTKIAFIRGPESHVYAKERYEGYLTAMSSHKIEIDQKLISPCGGWGLAEGAKAVKSFIQSGLIPGKDIEAIVCVGDNVAIGAQECLINQGYQVPYDVAVCGFNGTDDAAWCNPPITSVEMPFHGIGMRSFSTLMDKIEGKDVPEEYRYSTSLLLGESCGCKSISVQKAIIQQNENKAETLPFKKRLLSNVLRNKEEEKKFTAESELREETWRKSVRREIISDVESLRNIEATTVEFFKENIPNLISIFAESTLALETANSKFITEFRKALNKFHIISERLQLWQDFLSALYRKLQSITATTIYEGIVASTIQQARILLHEFDSRQQKQKFLWDLRYYAALRAISAELLSSHNVSELMDILCKSLKKLNIPGIYVVLYENCEYTQKNKKIPHKSKLILAVRDNERLNIKKTGFIFGTEKIIPDQFLPQSNFYSLILESLNFQDNFIGYIVFQEGPRSGGPYMALRDQLSSSLYGAILLEKLNKNKEAAESTMHSMTEKADLVVAHSKSISGNINNLSDTMESVTENIKAISEDITTVSETVDSTKQMIDDANVSITNLVDSTEKISNAIAMINDIAETTNVLALNASIEASHAGDAGKGFSVVAKEVKLLAAKTMSTTETIFELVTKNNKNTQDAKKVMAYTDKSIKKISELSESIKKSINEQVNSASTVASQIANASDGTEKISKAIDEIANLGAKLKD